VSKLQLLFPQSRDVTEDELTNIFSAHGNIVQMNLLKDKITGMPRGVAFVRYKLF
jgi:protein sex-lethal